MADHGGGAGTQLRAVPPGKTKRFDSAGSISRSDKTAPPYCEYLSGDSLPQSGTGLIHADRKLREQLREKRLAHGHKEDDHEEQQYGGWNMTMR